MCHRFAPLTIEEVREALELRERCGRATVRTPGPKPGQAASEAEGRASDAFPGMRVPIIVQQEDGKLAAAVRTWGFPGPDSAGKGAGPSAPAPSPAVTTTASEKSATRTGTPAAAAEGSPARTPSGKLVFNTRLDTALRQLREGRGLWAEAVAQGRCLVPVRAFYEWGPAGTVAEAETNQARSTEEGNGPTGASNQGAPKRPGTRPYRFVLPGAIAFLLAGIERDGRFSIVTTAPNAAMAPIHNRMPLVLGRGESARWLTGTAGTLAALADRSGIDLAIRAE